MIVSAWMMELHKEEAGAFIESYGVDMHEKTDINHPIFNRIYTDKEIRDFISVKFPPFLPSEVEKYISNFHVKEA